MMNLMKITMHNNKMELKAIPLVHQASMKELKVVPMLMTRQCRMKVRVRVLSSSNQAAMPWTRGELYNSKRRCARVNSLTGVLMRL